MEIVIDTHALFWYLSQNPKLSLNAKKLIKDAGIIVVPSIVILEILYLLRKNKMSYLFIDFLSEIKIHNFRVYPLGLDVIAQLLLQTTDLEMHDSIIVATAELLQAPLITKDRAIQNYYSNTVW